MSPIRFLIGILVKDFDEKKWRREIEGLRAEKDDWIKHSPHSPIPHEIRHHVTGLEYYPPDSKYHFVTKLNVLPDPEILRMTTSKGNEQNYLRYGYFEFQIEGRTQRLHAYKSVPAPGHSHTHEEESLFIPFRDATSGKESYGAARYLDLPLSPSGVYVLDFNLAYNPYCAYSENYVCPFPPPENWLQVQIKAGEKNFRKQ